jgi:hypothetical protein
VVCARRQFLKQRHGPKVAGALWMYGPDHVCSTSGRRIKPNKVTPVGSEPTPFRNGTLSQRLKPLGQSVLGKIRGIHAFDCRFCAKRPGSLQHHIWSRALPLGLHMDWATSHQLLQQASCTIFTCCTPVCQTQQTGATHLARSRAVNGRALTHQTYPATTAPLRFRM